MFAVVIGGEENDFGFVNKDVYHPSKGSRLMKLRATLMHLMMPGSIKLNERLTH